MNPWTILAWVTALTISIILIALAAAAVINIIRSIRAPASRSVVHYGVPIPSDIENAHPIYRGPNHDA